MFEYTPKAQPVRFHRGPGESWQGRALSNCQDCGKQMRLVDMHRIEAGGIKYKLCDRCCPNCFGGQGSGPE